MEKPFTTSIAHRALDAVVARPKKEDEDSDAADGKQSQENERPEHAVISTFDLFSVGVGPSSSHTVGPMRAGRIFVADLKNLGILEKVYTIKITL